MGGRSRAARLSLGALAALALPAAALAATLNVNSTADTPVAGDGQCTLREAIDNANNDSDKTRGDCPAGAGYDLIDVPAGLYSFSLSYGGYGISAPGVQIVGSGAASTRIVGCIRVGWDGELVLRRLSITSCAMTEAAVDSGGSLELDSVVLAPAPGAIGTHVAVIGGRARVTNSTFTGKRGIYFGLPGPWCDYGPCFCLELGGLTLVNSTVSTTREGLVVSGTCGVASIVDSTITGNTVAGLSGDLGSVELSNVVVAHQGAGLGCAPGSDPVSRGHNLDSDGSCGLTDPTDLSNVDPLLGPLQSNGGPTPTHALQLGSPAIDAIPSAACTYDHDGDPGTPDVALTKDQRGGARPREGNGGAPNGCDIGAYEVDACADGLDNDGDGLVDFDGGATAGITPLTSPDPNCANALGNSEATPPPSGGCGIGPELALLVPALLAVRRRRGDRVAQG